MWQLRRQSQAPEPGRLYLVRILPKRYTLLAALVFSFSSVLSCGPYEAPDPSNKPPVADAGANQEVSVSDIATALMLWVCLRQVAFS